MPHVPQNCQTSRNVYTEPISLYLKFLRESSDADYFPAYSESSISVGTSHKTVPGIDASLN